MGTSHNRGSHNSRREPYGTQMLGNPKVSDAADTLRTAVAEGADALDATVTKAGFVVQHHADAIEKLADTIVDTRETVAEWLFWIASGIAVGCALSLVFKALSTDGD